MTREERAGTGGAAATGRRGDLRARVLSGLVLALAVLALTYAGGLPFRCLAFAMAGAVFHELTAMKRASRAHRLVAATLLALTAVPAIWGVPAPAAFAALALAALVAVAHGLSSGQGRLGATAILYAGAPALALVYLRGADGAGLAAALFLFAVVWTSDVMAYFTGRALGGARLAPAISPGKTWSGAIGGAVFAVLAAVPFALYAGALHGPLLLGAVALALAVAAQLGDLFESALKRRCGVKDSGALIPGHGGVMDRVDGLWAAALVFYLLGALLSGPDRPAHAFFAL